MTNIPSKRFGGSFSFPILSAIESKKQKIGHENQSQWSVIPRRRAILPKPMGSFQALQASTAPVSTRLESLRDMRNGLLQDLMGSFQVLQASADPVSTSSEFLRDMRIGLLKSNDLHDVFRGLFRGQKIAIEIWRRNCASPYSGRFEQALPIWTKRWFEEWKNDLTCVQEILILVQGYVTTS